RAQCLLPRQRRATAARQNAKPVIEPCRQPADAEYIDPSRREFERQRYPIEPTTNLQHRRHISIVEDKPVRCRGCPFVEQLDGRITQRLGSSRGGARLRRELQRSQPVETFAFGPQWFLGGSQNTGMRRGLQERFSQTRCLANEVLAAVEDDQDMLVA